ncbi:MULTISPECIES: hypothetical protein [unclassified Pseudomonas]|uniref:hypothetical protein n=1 Tax=unclassified Pseudomonas TaxID=196821 RepID=UPI000BE2588C
MLHIMDAELIEGNYVLYQGDLSAKGLKQHLARWASAFPGDDGLRRKAGWPGTKTSKTRVS